MRPVPPGRRVGLVPTMGALHRPPVARGPGPRRVRRGRGHHLCQSAPVRRSEDIAGYPRTLERDCGVRRGGGRRRLRPDVTEMYPAWPAAPSTTVRCAASARPGRRVPARPLRRCGDRGDQALRHGRAVPGLLWPEGLPAAGRGPSHARDLSLPVEVIGCPIVREPDGLALSSRNARLSPDERRAATVLSRALAAGRAAMEDGERSGAAVRRIMRAVVATEPLVQLDYAAVVDADTLDGRPPSRGARPRDRSACSSPPRSARSGSSTTAPR